LGINNPITRGRLSGDDYVLQKFTDQEEQIVKELLEKAVKASETMQTDGLEIVQAKFNG
jgi:peptidyl-tRNA hydrolase